VTGLNEAPYHLVTTTATFRASMICKCRIIKELTQQCTNAVPLVLGQARAIHRLAENALLHAWPGVKWLLQRRTL